ncbi:MAG TPA: NitrOD5 domain-containing protein [Nitrosarchaeum sp.]|nr:NitrOD5 domain-containing protein [Nitrosarchaeum sp.]
MYNARSALVMSAIENALLNIGNDVYEKVVNTLENQFNANLSDCFEHPEYLKKALNDLFGESARVIILAISRKVEEHAYEKDMEHFVTIINTPSK